MFISNFYIIIVLFVEDFRSLYVAMNWLIQLQNRARINSIKSAQSSKQTGAWGRYQMPVVSRKRRTPSPPTKHSISSNLIALLDQLRCASLGATSCSPFWALFYSIFAVFCQFHVRYGAAKRMLCLSSSFALFFRRDLRFGWFRWFIYSPDDFLVGAEWLFARLHGRLRAIFRCLFQLWMWQYLSFCPVISGDLSYQRTLFVNEFECSHFILAKVAIKIN